MAEGRVISKLIEATQSSSNRIKATVVRETVQWLWSLRGSSGASCAQVQTHSRRSRSTFSAAAAAATAGASNKHMIANSRGDDISNYKPLSWKCKCGDYFFNP
ncbi:hypothetical protein FNV43_RR11886 [Rhamnella rubrinervis]|uniref:Epidermal patterning factor-like protein n=1 Tax=Rhamnella rubrinervis TaxID=2594499 RepID=A0A8K0MI15_9ROSA|nr:hypothetical protein FNV43_RR11886 [Rhamnella rubrinervis]